MRLDFTDQFQDSNIANTYDFPARKMNVVQGRWLSPDPAGLAAMDLTNPQTFNRYAYVGNNPLAAVDPLGLCDEGVGDDCGGGGAGGVPGYCPPSMEYCGDPPFPPIGVGGGGGGGGLGAGAGSPPAAPSPVPSPTNPNGPPSFGCENLGIPCGMPFPQGGLLDILGIDPGCEFGPCVPMAGPYTDPDPTTGGLNAQFTFHTQVWGFLPGFFKPWVPPQNLGYPSPKSTSGYGVPGTQCSKGCHPEPPSNAPDIFNNCQKVGALLMIGGWMGGPWFEGTAELVVYGVSNTAGTATFFACL